MKKGERGERVAESQRGRERGVPHSALHSALTSDPFLTLSVAVSNKVICPCGCSQLRGSEYKFHVRSRSGVCLPEMNWSSHAV